ncbi:hypothetical protein V8C43DRAFT_74462 [Trichoderma afarasin]
MTIFLVLAVAWRLLFRHGKRGYCTSQGSCERLIIGGAPLAVSTVMDPTQWLVFPEHKTTCSFPWLDASRRENNSLHNSGAKKLLSISHQAYIGTLLGSPWIRVWATQYDPRIKTRSVYPLLP